MNWQPIETAPKDGSPILVSSSCRVGESSWGVCLRRPHYGYVANNGQPCWRSADGLKMFPGIITHWMPMPCPNDTDGDGNCHKCFRSGACEFNPPAPLPIRKLPNAVKQTTQTNCFRACVATILNLPIEEVPEACDGAKWDWDAFQDWLAKMNLQAIEMTFLNGGTMYPVRKPVLCIATGQSPRIPEVQHAVVAEFIGLEGFRLLHDPHMDDLWIDGEPTHATFFVRITDASEHA